MSVPAPEVGLGSCIKRPDSTRLETVLGVQVVSQAGSSDEVCIITTDEGQWHCPVSQQVEVVDLGS